MMRSSLHRLLSRRRAREEGAVMVVVLLVLMSATALGVYSVHSSAFEARAAGFSRQAMQARLSADSAVTATFAFIDDQGVEALHNIRENSPATTLAPFEPELAAGQESTRLLPLNFTPFAAANGSPVSADALGARDGAAQPYTPTYWVDINDEVLEERPIAGVRADGGGNLHYYHMSYTARSRMTLTAGDYTGVDNAVDPRSYSEISGASRAFAVSGPAP